MRFHRAFLVAVVVVALAAGLASAHGAASAQAPLPHETDNVDEPILEFVGEIPAETADRFRAEFDGMLAFFRDRFGDVPLDYTLFVAADARSGAAAVGSTYRNDFCNEGDLDYRILVSDCHAFLPEHIAAYHFWAIKRLLAPRTVWPAASATYGPWGPEWLRDGLDEYVRVAYRAAAEIEPFDRARRWKAALARLTPRALNSIGTCAAGSEVPCAAINGLGFLAVDWLVARAGELAIVEYYRLLPSSGHWREAFEGAFGIGTDDFYRAFEEQRRVITGAPVPSTTTTPLQPGWNLIGWMGPGTTVADLFAAIPALQVVAAWDREAVRYAWARRGGRTPPGLAQVTRGQALFLWVGGTDPVVWTRPGSAAGMLLTLPSGSSLVGWAGLDGTPIAEAVGRFGEALVGASRWNAATQSYERYDPGAEEPAEGMPVLQHGDALWVELSEERRWWQSGTERTDFVFRGDVSAQRQSELRNEMERVVAFFAERYTIKPPEFVVVVDSMQARAAASDWRIRIGGPFIGSPLIGGTLAHEYFHVLQWHLSQGDRRGSPLWMIEGSATYAEGLYALEWYGAADAQFGWWWGSSRRIPAALRDLTESSWPNAEYPLGALATDWLVRWSVAANSNVQFSPPAPGGLVGWMEDDAYVDFFRHLPSSETWEEALEGAFGITIDDFYAAFEAYRSDVVLPIPHLADDVDEPILVFAGEIPAETMDRIREQFEGVGELFRDRFGDPPADYTVVVAADYAAAASVAPEVFGEHLDTASCALSDPAYSVEILTCDPTLVRQFTWQHFTTAVERLAPIDSLPPSPGSSDRRAPLWLHAGLVRYVRDAARAALGVEPLADIRRSHTGLAELTAQPLRSLRTYADMDGAGWRVWDSLTFLAVEWLADHAGEPALFEYYRLLPSSRSWQEAFAGAFGIGVDDFYAAFEAYRADGFTS